MSRSASAAPRSPATVEKRTRQSVFYPPAKDRGPGVFGDVVRHGEGPKLPILWRACGVRGSLPGRNGRVFRDTIRLAAWRGRARRRFGCFGCRQWVSRFRRSVFSCPYPIVFVGMQKMPDRFMIEFHIVVIQSKNIAIQTGVASLGICFSARSGLSERIFQEIDSVFEDLENFTIFVPLTGD